MQIPGMGGAGQAAQLQQWRERMYQRADQDQSGGLSLAEFSQMAARRQGTPPANSAASPAEPTRGGGTTQAASAVQDMFTRIDRDGDGSLSRAELEAGRPNPGTAARLDSATLSALISTQGQENGRSARDVARPAQREQHRDSRAAGQPDAALLRQLAAYQARQATNTAALPGGAALTA